MSGRLGHTPGDRRVGHVPINGIRKTNYAYGFGGAYFWLDASMFTSTKTNGSAISEWKDRLLNMLLYQYTGANQPTFTLSDINFNNYSSVVFSANNFMNISQPLGFPQDFVIAVVYKINTIQTTGNNLFRVAIGTGDSTFDIIGLQRQATASGEYIRNAGGIQNANPTINNTSPHISIYTPTKIYRDGTNMVSGLTAFPLNSALFLGVNTTGRQLTSSIAEIICYDASLTEDQLVTLSDNINSKYAIY
jgi:hypothetical protein